MSKKILIADDEPDILKMLYYTLRKLDCEIFQADNGKDALELAIKEKPDLVVLDYKMPVIDGIQVSRRLKSSDETKDIKIILITASIDGINEKFNESLADRYVLKPFEAKDMFEEAKNILGL
ncbi:MAG: response regulator [Candidatus Theseobacter exili]|nr:response regulator [Candidatus Theseobacter exili]